VDLLRQFALGDLDAFESLFRLHEADVYHWVLCLVRVPAAAEDLTLDAFYRIYRAHARFDPSREFAPWARRIAVNLALTHLRRSPREFHPDSRFLESYPARSSPDPSAGDTRHAIRLAFHSLPVRLRAVATLALIEEKPYSEIAAALSISLEAVKSREFRAVRLLRKKLSEMDIEP